jgi:hypothetical protein
VEIERGLEGTVRCAGYGHHARVKDRAAAVLMNLPVAIVPPASVVRWPPGCTVPVYTVGTWPKVAREVSSPRLIMAGERDGARPGWWQAQPDRQ